MNSWEDLFRRWPNDLAKKGLLVTSWGEQIPFDGFMLGGGFLLLQRQTPDSLGARMLVVPCNQISALKLTEVVKAKSVQALGFEGSLPKT